MITRERKGFGILRNLGIGLVGALVGGQLFPMLGLFPDLDRVAISLRDVVAALIGSLLILAVIGLYHSGGIAIICPPPTSIISVLMPAPRSR
jgi:uncharacterized membrane protein YeaQ/YmgE (transglycosylase-associated protein family)